MSIAKSDASLGNKGRLYRAGIVALATLVLAVSVVGVWYSKQAPDNAARVDRPSAALAQRAFVFTPYPSPRAIANVEFQDGQGNKRTLADFRGKVVLLNIWATWCGPCREEMPTLDRLQSRLGGADFEVVALSIDRGGQAVVRSFYDEIGARALAIYVDASADTQAKLGVIGVPTTLLIDREGREVTRYTGPAQWDRPEVITTIQRYLPTRKP